MRTPSKDVYDEDWFLSRSIITPGPLDTPCWFWKGAISRGYGTMNRTVHRGPVHRWAYICLIGDPGDLHCDPLCRNRICINPHHLEPVTNKVNVLRGTAPSAVNAKKTHCPAGHPYAGDNLIVTKRGGRECKTCKRLQRRLYERKRNNSRARLADDEVRTGATDFLAD